MNTTAKYTESTTFHDYTWDVRGEQGVIVSVIHSDPPVYEIEWEGEEETTWELESTLERMMTSAERRFKS